MSKGAEGLKGHCSYSKRSWHQSELWDPVYVTSLSGLSLPLHNERDALATPFEPLSCQSVCLEGGFIYMVSQTEPPPLA